MSKVKICKHVISAIERHARFFKGVEIYGWLLGYDKNEELVILASIPCKMYKAQNEIRAEPSNEEVMEISKNIPKGIGIVGIYHSHPNKVFHSATDDLTVRQFASIYPHFLSIVTNGKETKSYQLRDIIVEEIKTELIAEPNLSALSFSLNLEYYYNPQEDFTLALVSSQIREFLEENPIQSLFYKSSPIEDKRKINNLTKGEIEIKLSSNIIGKNDASTKNVTLNLSFDIVSTPKSKIADIKAYLPQGIKDAMYYLIKNTKIKEGQFILPQQFKFEISNIPWRFNVKKDDIGGTIKFLDTLAFRVEHMSFRDEKKRITIYDELIRVKQMLEKDISIKDKLDELLLELSKKI
ncbi:MAG: Mov34/MPN/PAD-1 family protein [Candidatus Heimdallarchaeaceae archaeon]